MSRLSKAGFKQAFVQAAILPDWWDPTCAADASLLPDIEFRVARFLGAPLSVVRAPDAPLHSPHYPGARLRRATEMAGDRLAPAIHVALQVARAVVRSLRAGPPTPRLPPTDGAEWRELMRPPGRPASIKTIATDLWARGIPVVPLETLPGPSFQALACIVDGCPVVLLGQKYDELGRCAFIVAHEVGHLVAGDCAEGSPVVDEEDDQRAASTADDGDMENRADAYAGRVLTGGVEGVSVELPEGAHYKQIASYAMAIERARGIDASHLVGAWARRTGKYATAQQALKAMYRSSGARAILAALFEHHVDVDAATESDGLLLRCVQRAAAPDEAAS